MYVCACVHVCVCVYIRVNMKIHVNVCEHVLIVWGLLYTPPIISELKPPKTDTTTEVKITLYLVSLIA